VGYSAEETRTRVKKTGLNAQPSLVHGTTGLQMLTDLVIRAAFVSAGFMMSAGVEID